MAKRDIIIKNYNGTGWDTLYPETSSNQVLTPEGGTIEDKVNNKVDKVDGKQLSTEDFTTELKSKLEAFDESITVSNTEPSNKQGIWFELKD